jgi:hypothetical protein
VRLVFAKPRPFSLNQRDVEQQLDAELAQHKAQLAAKAKGGPNTSATGNASNAANANTTGKTPLQWENLRKSLLRERMQVCLEGWIFCLSS